jgi:hypothetical protein
MQIVGNKRRNVVKEENIGGWMDGWMEENRKKEGDEKTG